MKTKLIDTPYGRKTPALLCRAMDAVEREPQLIAALKEAAEFVDLARQYFPKSIRHADTFKLNVTRAAIGTALHNAEAA